MKKPQEPQHWYLKVRRYKDSPLCSVWLATRDGAVHQSFMHGTIDEDRVAELQERLGLEVVDETHPMDGWKPTIEGDAKRQQALFAEEVIQ